MKIENYCAQGTVLNQLALSREKSMALTIPSWFRSETGSDENQWEFMIDQSREFTILSWFKSPTSGDGGGVGGSGGVGVGGGGGGEPLHPPSLTPAGITHFVEEGLLVEKGGHTIVSHQEG